MIEIIFEIILKLLEIGFCIVIAATCMILLCELIPYHIKLTHELIDALKNRINKK